MRCSKMKIKVLTVGLACGALIMVVLAGKYDMKDGRIFSNDFPSLRELMTFEWMRSDPFQNKNMFHVIVTFRIINSTEDKRAGTRMNEYMESLNSSLSHQHVKQVHLMYDSPDMPAYIQNHLGSPEKLVLHQVASPDIVLTLHQFAFTYLQGQLVVITQADIILGEGFQAINGSLLEENRVMYSLSRHVRGNCKTGIDRCKNYVGSHDTFVFVPRGEITPEGKILLNHFVYSWGTEGVIMRVYGKHLNYTILNPCWTFRVYHNHCSNFRKYTHKQPKLAKVIRDVSRPTDRLV